MKKQNLDIQFFKFFYSCIIVLYHMAAWTDISCKGGYYGVEYFLLTAGLFLFLSFRRGEARGKNQTPGQYLWKRFVRFLPWSTTAFILTVLVKRVWVDPVESLSAWAKLFPSDIFELLMVKANGMNNNAYLVNNPAWTLSAMLIVGFVIWTLLYHYKKPFIHLIMPITIIAGYGYWMHLSSANTEAWMGFTTFGAFRTWLVMCLSFYCIPMSEKLAQLPFTRLGKCLLTLAELLIHAFSLFVIFRWADRYYQWLLTLLFMVSIAIALSGHSYLEKLFGNSKLIALLGDVSMSIYLVHTAVILGYNHIYHISDWSYGKLLPLFAILFAVSLAHYYGTKGLVWLLSKLWGKTKTLIIR